MIQKINSVYFRTNGVIKTRQELELVKDVINLSMRLAIFYILLFVLFLIFVVMLFINGAAGRAIGILFLFGIITLPIGLIGKHFENKIRTMEVQSEDPELATKFQHYLKEWNSARFQLSD